MIDNCPNSLMIDYPPKDKNKKKPQPTIILNYV